MTRKAAIIGSGVIVADISMSAEVGVKLGLVKRGTVPK